MKHVCTIDVAKGKSMVFLTISVGEILLEPYEIIHNLSDLDSLDKKD